MIYKKKLLLNMPGFIYSIPFSMLVTTSSAQINKQVLQKDSLKTIKVNPVNKRNVAMPVSEQIKTGLQKIIDSHRNEHGIETTWKKIRNEANTFLYSFYKNGNLQGRKPEEAYYVIIGVQSMTTQDIAMGRKILIAGIAEFKPAEFNVISVETETGK